jgi:hypothetical protein
MLLSALDNLSFLYQSHIPLSHVRASADKKLDQVDRGSSLRSHTQDSPTVLLNTIAK